ncbi:MAG: DUF4340 domain-containing protein [Verrucomicrobia bacterium]|nr:DUF4340 domain-containing protein [Verrucomicrobiota bacterium]
MKLRTTLVLLIIAVAMGAFIFGLDRWSRSTRERRERAAHVVRVTRANVQGFTIHDGDELIKVRTEGDAWKMIAPWQDDADAGIVDQLLDAIQSLRPEDVITDLGRGEKKRRMLQDFGLNKSRLRLKLDGKQMPAELQFGQDTAVQGECYLRITDDDAVYVVSNSLKNIVSKKPGEFRDHRMTPFLTTLINRAIFRVSGGEIELAKEQDDWMLVRPIKARASNDAVVDILTRINQTQIAKFVSDDKSNPGSFGLDSPSNVITLFGDEQKNFEIDIGSAVPSRPDSVYAGLPQRNSVVELSRAFANLFNITPNDLRDRKIARLNSDLIDRVTIERPDQSKIVLGRDENRWRFLSPVSGPANSENIIRLIQELNDGEVSEFVSDTATDLTKYGLDQPRLKISFSSYSTENTAEANAGETVLATLAFGNSENGATYARLEEEPYIFSIADQLVAALPTTEFSFRTLQVLDLRRDQLVSLVIERRGEEPTDLVRDMKGRWILKDRENHQNDGQIQLFLNTLTGLRATAWIGNPKPEYSLDQPSLVIKISYQSREQDREVDVKFGTANAGNQHYGLSTEEAGVFLVDDPQFKQLNASLKQ